MSATLPDVNSLANWLDAELYQTIFRPVQLNECLKLEENIYDKTGSVISRIEVDKRIEKFDKEKDLLSHLVLETMKNKKGVLVFCPTKTRCESLAEHIAKTIENLVNLSKEIPAYLSKEKLTDCLYELKATPAGLDDKLMKTVKYGVGFHHAGLTMEEREIIENYFKNGFLLVIVCTSTLSSGVYLFIYLFIYFDKSVINLNKINL